jgi:hypothetical protein
VVQRLLALLGRVHADTEVILQLLLADELIEAAGAQGDVDRFVVVLRLAGDDPLSGRAGLLRMPVLLKDYRARRTERPELWCSKRRETVRSPPSAAA